MAKATGAKTESTTGKEAAIAKNLETLADTVVDAPEASDTPEVTDTAEAELVEPKADGDVGAKAPEISSSQDVDECLNALKTLLSTVEKLQKVRQDVGDIKPMLVRMLDGEVLSGEELEQLKVGVGGLLRLVRAYTDHQTALTNAQPARALLDQILKTTGTDSSSS